jgi:putative transposase
MNQPQTIRFWRGRLPHWEVVDGRYFVTTRQAGSLPTVKAAELDAFLAGAGAADYLQRSRRYFVQMERWLECDSTCEPLLCGEVAMLIVNSIHVCERRGFWSVPAYVVMPNHVHLFCLPGTLSLSEIVRRFKHYTATEANRLLRRQGHRFWQVEWFDHWSRSPQEDDRIKSYIRNNPVKAGLARDGHDWPFLK